MYPGSGLSCSSFSCNCLKSNSDNESVEEHEESEWALGLNIASLVSILFSAFTFFSSAMVNGGLIESLVIGGNVLGVSSKLSVSV